MTADAKLLAELKEYFERLKHRADVRGGPDVSAMGIAEEAIQLIDAALASPRYVQGDDSLNFERLAEVAPPGDVARVLKITTADRQVFYSRDWTPPLVEALSVQANKRHGGVTRMELILMRLADYNAIPATNASAELFAL
jgi:hypothetical protein